MKTKIKTIDVTAYEWFDKVNGNSYFAGAVTVNYGMKTEKIFTMPLQYGYEDHYRYVAFELLQGKNVIPPQPTNTVYWRYYRDNNIIARHTKHEGCKKADLKKF